MKLRSDPWLALGGALVALGLLIRAALYFPPAMFQIDSDAVLAGLCAFRIASGQHPFFFPGGSRLSAASCYVAAGYFHLFGPGRAGLALTGLTWAALYLLFTLLFLRAALGPKKACLAFLFAVIPSEQFMTVSYAPWGYGEIMASCAATLWLAALWRNTGALWQRVGFGLSAGLGVWFSLQTLMIALPAIAWVALKRRGATIREAIPALPAAILGALPFLIGNVASGFATFTQNWASRPVSSASQFFDNFIWVLTTLIPKLLFRLGGWPPETALFIAAYAVIAIAFAIAWNRDERGRAAPNSVREISWLLGFAFVACVLIFSLSQAGTIRAWTVRYIAPLYLVVPLFCGIGIAALWRWSRWLAALCVSALLIPNLFLYGLPGSPLRADLTNQLRNDVRLRALLAQRRVRMVYGNYVWVYHLNFDSHERIAAVPFVPVVDYMDYGGSLGTSSVRWASLGNLAEVRGWSRAAGARGFITMDGDLYVFIADRPAPNAAALLTALRGAPP